MIHTYLKSRNEPIWTVGYYMPSDQMWIPLKDFSTEEAAAAYASYLNGGAKP